MSASKFDKLGRFGGFPKVETPRAGRTCEKHGTPQWCPDGVCPYCEPAPTTCTGAPSEYRALMDFYTRRWDTEPLFGVAAQPAPRSGPPVVSNAPPATTVPPVVFHWHSRVDQPTTDRAEMIERVKKAWRQAYGPKEPIE